MGTWVLALGSPFGLMHSVSQGIISARSRHMDELQDVENQDFLQTDAAINPGNSGGPLVNMKGEVIGINNSIASNGGGNEGVGFSIPINLARWIMNELIAHGHVTRGALGVDLQTNFRQEDATNLGLDRPPGRLDRQGPSRFAGGPGRPARRRRHPPVRRRRDSRPEPPDQHRLHDPGRCSRRRDHLARSPGSSAPDHRGRPRPDAGRRPTRVPGGPGEGDPAELIRRPNRPDTTSSFAIGLELVTLNPQMALRYQFPESMQGALIVAIDPESPLSPVCHVNDVISKVNDQPIRSAEDGEADQRASGARSPDPQRRPPRRSGIERYTIRVP